MMAVMKRMGWLGLASWGLACTASEPLFVPQPDLETPGALVFGLARTERLELSAYEANTLPARLQFEPSSDDASDTLYAITYAESATTLYLETGPLRSFTTGGRSLPPRPSRVLEYPLANPEASGWRDVELLPDVLSKFRFELGPKLCPELSGVTHPLPGLHSTGLATNLSGGRILVVTQLSSEEDPTGNVSSLVLVEGQAATDLGSPFASRLIAAAEMDDGEIWFLERSGLLHRGRIEVDQVVVETSTAAPAAMSEPRAMAGGRSASGVELYMKGVDEDLWRWSPNGATKIGQLTRNVNELSAHQMLWFGPETLLATSGKSSETLLYAGGRATVLPLPTLSGVRALSHHPSLGTFAGGSNGELFQLDGESWRLFAPSSQGRDAIVGLAPFRYGFVYLLRLGLGQIAADVICPGVLATGDTDTLLTVGDDIYVFRGGPLGGSSSVEIFTPP